MTEAEKETRVPTGTWAQTNGAKVGTLVVVRDLFSSGVNIALSEPLYPKP